MLVPQGFWGALQSQGAPNIQGDAYMTYWDTRTSVVNDEFGPDAFYQYGIEFPAGSSGGEVWLFDPGFCHVDTDKGTGESYTLGGSNGSSSFNPVSTFYDLFDTRNTPYDLTDDTLIYSSGNAYRQTTWRDTLLDVASPVTADPCDDLAWHNDWARIANNLPGNRTYRLHTYSTDPNDANDQRQTTALNAFAIWSTASGGTPRVYGLGAMEAYVRLPGGRSTEFYLAQIDAEHAGKTLAIGLWDPGDTGALAANLQILQPTHDRLHGRALQLHRGAGFRGRGQLQQQERHERDLGHHQHRWHQPVQRLLAEHRDPLAHHLRCPAPLVRYRRHRGRLVEDPLQHEWCHHLVLHGPDDMGGRGSRQPRPSRGGVVGPPTRQDPRAPRQDPRRLGRTRGASPAAPGSSTR